VAGVVLLAHGPAGGARRRRPLGGGSGFEGAYTTRPLQIHLTYAFDPVRGPLASFGCGCEAIAASGTKAMWVV
jgi:hypothetical protein